MQPVRTAVITAAGFATRFLPVSKSIPKVMLPLIDRPVIQYSVEQARAAGIDRIVVVASRGSAVIQDYFDRAPELEQALEARNSPYLAETRRVSELADVILVRQREQLGLGHAVQTARQVVGDEPFVVYLPDEVILGEPSATAQLLRVYEERGGGAIGVVEVPHEQVSRFGVVAGEPVSERETRLTHVVEKPRVENAPSNLAITGPYVLTPAVFDAMERVKPGAGGEIQLTDAIAAVARQEPVFAYRYEGRRYDCGTPLGLLKASVEAALERSDLRAEVREWLAALAARGE